MRGGKRQNAPPRQFDGEESHDLEKPSTGSTLLTGAGQDDRRVTCTYCRRNHVSSKCDVITIVNVRRAILMKKARCFVCLKPSHRARDCQSTNKCFKCQGRHHVSLCDPQRTNDRQNLNKERDPQTNLITVAKSSSTLLQTAQAEIFSKSSGRRETVRVILDKCAQKSFINLEVKEKLGLPVLRREKMILQGFETDNAKPRVMNVVRAFICGIKSEIAIEVDMYVVPNICAPITGQTIELAQATYEHLIELDLADKTNGSNKLKIDVLIGGDFYEKIVFDEQKVRGKVGPTATKTTLGWVLSGPTDFSSSNCVSTNLVSSHILQVGCVPDVLGPSDRDSQLIEQVKGFWLTEETGVETQLENTYDIIESVIYENRKYSVPLPWKLNPDDLPDNYSLAKARLNSLFRRLKKSPEYLKEYDNII